MEEDDLFSQPELIPENVQEIFDRYYEEHGEEMEYSDTERMQKEVEAEGYTFDFDLDNVPYNLRKSEIDNSIEFTIPTWALSALINGDESGLEEEDIEKLNKFVDETHKEYGNASFMLGDKSEDTEFYYRNDIDGTLGGDVTTLYLIPSNKMAKGGSVGSDIPESISKRITEINELIEWSKDKDSFVGGYFGGTYYEYLDFEKPITTKNQFVYIEYDKGAGRKSKERFNVAKKGEFDANGLVELKQELSRILGAFKRAKKKYDEKGYFAKGGVMKKTTKYIVFYTAKETGGMRERLFENEQDAKEFANSVDGSVSPIKFAKGGSVGKYENYVNNIYSRQSEQDISDQLYSFAKENGYDFADIEEIVEKQPFEEGVWGDRVYTKSAIRKMIREVAGLPEEFKEGGEIENTKQSSMTDKEKEKLTRISRLLDNNQVNDPELKAKLQAERDMLEEKVGKVTSAPKSTPAPAPKATPKAKKAAAPKAEAPAPKAKKSGETVMEYAKRTRKSGESWPDAVHHASKEVKNGGKPVAKKIKKAAAKAKPVVKKFKKPATKKVVAKVAPKTIKKSATKKKATTTAARVIKRSNYLNGSSSKTRDKQYKALHPGKRMAKAGHKNQYGTSDGKGVYYEYRRNHADLNRTKKLAKGGGVGIDWSYTSEDGENYSKKDFLDAAKGNQHYAELLRQRVEWQSPYTMVEEDLREGEIEEKGGTYVLLMKKGGGVGKKAKKIARQKPKRDTAKDKTIKALHAGKRTTDWGTTYVENRVNRSDKNRTKKFAKGGGVGQINVGDSVNLTEIKFKSGARKGEVQFERVNSGVVKYIEDGIYGVYNPKTKRIHQVTKDQIENK